MVRLSFPIYYTKERKTKKAKTFLVAFNWFRNAYHYEINEVKHHYHDLVAKQIGSDKFTKLKVHYDIYTKKTTDGGNIRSVIEKFVLDGLKECGVIPDDNVTVVTGDSANYHAVKDNFRCEITLTGE